MDNKEIDYKRAAEQLRKGEPLFGKDGALAPMLERISNATKVIIKDIRKFSAYQVSIT